MPLPYRNLAGNLQQQIEIAISEQSQVTGVFESVLMRKKWLSELYAFAVKRAENGELENPMLESQLSAWLTGWRADWIKAKILPILQVPSSETAEVTLLSALTKIEGSDSK